MNYICTINTLFIYIKKKHKQSIVNSDIKKGMWIVFIYVGTIAKKHKLHFIYFIYYYILLFIFAWMLEHFFFFFFFRKPKDFQVTWANILFSIEHRKHNKCLHFCNVVNVTLLSTKWAHFKFDACYRSQKSWHGGNKGLKMQETLKIFSWENI